jgi:hypothetical protein
MMAERGLHIDHTCAGYVGHLFAELDVLRFIKRACLSKHTIGTYNHSGSESIAVLSTLMKERSSWRLMPSRMLCNDEL